MPMSAEPLRCGGEAVGGCSSARRKRPNRATTKPRPISVRLVRVQASIVRSLARCSRARVDSVEPCAGGAVGGRPGWGITPSSSDMDEVSEEDAAREDGDDGESRIEGGTRPEARALDHPAAGEEAGEAPQAHDAAEDDHRQPQRPALGMGGERATVSALLE